jgi:hypothetical protein
MASSRTAVLNTLPDVPATTNASYPSYTLPSYTPALPLPPRTHIQPTKPPLPPRPGGRSTTSPTVPSRIANPFAALFGSSSNTTLNHVKPAPLPVPSSPTGSLRSLDSQAEHGVEVSAFTINKKIIRKDVAKDMNKLLRKEVKELLLVSAPSWVVERVHEFTADWYPFVKDKDKDKDKNSAAATTGGYRVAWIGETPEKTAERVQDFYLALEQDLRVLGFGNGGKGKHIDDYDPYGYENDEKRVQEKMVSESKIKDVMEVVERTVCSLFYDR